MNMWCLLVRRRKPFIGLGNGNWPVLGVVVGRQPLAGRGRLKKLFSPMGLEIIRDGQIKYETGLGHELAGVRAPAG
jgi:hypothetical protein